MQTPRPDAATGLELQTPFIADPDFTLYVGDCLSVLRSMPEESVHCIVTSPPYLGLRDYGIEPSVWGGDPEHDHEWGDAVSVRETTYGGKTRWQHVHNGRGEFQESRADREGWLRSEVALGAFCECGAWLGVLGLEPSISLYVDHLVVLFRELRRVLRPDGTCWLNLGDSYNAYNGNAGPSSALSQRQSAARPRLATGHGLQQKELKPKDLMMVPARAAIALCEDGWWLRSEITWGKVNPMPESVADRPTKATERVYLLAKSERYYFGQDDLREPWQASSVERDAYSYGHAFASQFKGSPTDGRHQDGKQLPPGAFASGWPNEGRNVRDLWLIPTQPYPEAHFAVFPEELARRCILGGCPPSGVVLDPFMGSGTTALVARRHGRRSVGIELNPEYAALAARRLSQLSLLAEEVA